jgi:hypothetical protein
MTKKKEKVVKPKTTKSKKSKKEVVLKEVVSNETTTLDKKTDLVYETKIVNGVEKILVIDNIKGITYFK